MADHTGLRGRGARRRSRGGRHAAEAGRSSHRAHAFRRLRVERRRPRASDVSDPGIVRGWRCRRRSSPARAREEPAKKLGAAHVIDKSTEDLWRAAERIAPKGYDVVLDANGVSTLAESYKHLRPTGRLVIYGFHSMMRKGAGTPSWPKLAADWLRTPRFNPLDLTNDNKSVMAFNLSYLFEERGILEESMGRLMTLANAGAIEPPPTRIFPLERVADAHRALETGTTTGKLVLSVSRD